MSLFKCQIMNPDSYDLFAISVASVMLGYVYSKGDNGRELEVHSCILIGSHCMKMIATSSQTWTWGLKLQPLLVHSLAL